MFSLVLVSTFHSKMSLSVCSNRRESICRMNSFRQQRKNLLPCDVIVNESATATAAAVRRYERRFSINLLNWPPEGLLHFLVGQECRRPATIGAIAVFVLPQSTARLTSRVRVNKTRVHLFKVECLGQSEEAGPPSRVFNRSRDELKNSKKMDFNSLFFFYPKTSKSIEKDSKENQ